MECSGRGDAVDDVDPWYYMIKTCNWSARSRLLSSKIIVFNMEGRDDDRLLDPLVNKNLARPVGLNVVIDRVWFPI